MQYRYKDGRTRKFFEDDRTFKKLYGEKGLKNRDRRLNEITNYKDVAELLSIGKSGPGNWHTLDNRDGGHYAGKISGDITGNLRLILDKPEQSLGVTTSVVILEIKDTHK